MSEEMHIFIHWQLLYSGAMIPHCQPCFNFSGNWLCVSKWRKIQAKNPIQRHERFIGPRGVRISQRRFQSQRQGQLTYKNKFIFAKGRRKETKLILWFCFFFFPFDLAYFSFFPWVINSKRNFCLHQCSSKQKVGISSSESYQLFLTFGKWLVEFEVTWWTRQNLTDMHHQFLVKQERNYC